jgi:pimeloyl-ACP methyl ester carboxylesterase
MVGEQDIVTPIKFSEPDAQKIPNAEFVILKQLGHACFIESPEVVAQEMLKFLTNHCLENRERGLGIRD